MNLEIEKLIKGAEKELVFISPFIKLHERLKYELTFKQNKEKLKLTRSKNKVPTVIKIDNDDVVPLMAGQEIGWNCSNI